jgi:hypothetical protein
MAHSPSLPLSLTQPPKGGVHLSGPSPTSNPFSLAAPAAGLPRRLPPPRLPASLRLLHYAIKAPPHTHSTASPLPFPSRNRLHRGAAAAINGAPAELRHCLTALFPLPPQPYKGVAPPPASPAPLPSPPPSPQHGPRRSRSAAAPISSSAVIPSPPSPW